MKRTLTFSQKHDLKTVQVLPEIKVLHYMCDSIKIVIGLLSYLVYLVLFGSCIAHAMIPVKESLSSKSPKRQREDFSVIHNKIGKPAANLLKYFCYWKDHF